MNYVLRDYQQAAVDATFTYWREVGGNPILDLATGAGKSVINAEICKRTLEMYPGMRIICVTHQKELLEQNLERLLSLWPQAPVGIYSASIGRRDRNAQILFGGVQTIYNKLDEIGGAHLFIVDEAHTINPKSNTMYGRMFEDAKRHHENYRSLGLTATPYRLDCGLLYGDTDETMFDDIAYQVNVGELISRGYLSPVVPKAMRTTFDMRAINYQGGDFNSSQVDQLVNTLDTNAAVVNEIVQVGHDRKSILVFASSIDHAEQLTHLLDGHGFGAECVTGSTSKGEREDMVRRFKNGELRCLVNVNVFTTGFDAPNVDLVALCRPTASPGLYQQMVGRGLRISPDTGKTNCLVLDFAGNVKRHGPIDDVQPPPTKKRRSESDKVGDAPVKVCPQESCRTILPIQCSECYECGYVFPEPVETDKIDRTADTRALLKNQGHFEDERAANLPGAFCRTWTFERHEKQGAATSMKVGYYIPSVKKSAPIPEWVCFEHAGGARKMAERWWTAHGGQEPYPSTTSEAIVRAKSLRCPDRIVVQEDGSYTRVKSFLYDAPGTFSNGADRIVYEVLKQQAVGVRIEDIMDVTGQLYTVVDDCLGRLKRRKIATSQPGEVDGLARWSALDDTQPSE